MSNTGKNQASHFFRRTVTFFVLLFIGAFLFWFAFRGVAVKSVIREIKGARIGWVLVSFLITVISHFFRAARWNLLINPLGYKPSVFKTFYAVMTGYLANLAFPRLGEVTRCASLTKEEKIPFNKLLGTVITERIIDVICLLICLLITAMTEYNRLGSFLRSRIIDPVLDKLRAIGSPVLLLLSFAFITILFFVVRFMTRKKGGIFNKISRSLKGVVDGAKSIASIERPGLFLFYSIFIWFLYFLGVYVTFFALESTKDLDVSAALFLLVAGGVAMSAPVQGGIGTYHLLVSQGLVLFGLPQDEGLAFATILHGLQMIAILIFGGLSVIMISFQKNNPFKPT